jgi:aspartyl-tRNA synthetase
LERFGTDRPDLRFGLELVDLTDLASESGFKIFEAADTVKGINVKGSAGFSRKQIEQLEAIVKPFGAKGLAYLSISEDGARKSSFAKHVAEGRLDAMLERLKAEEGDLLLVLADTAEIVNESLSRLRAHLGRQLELYDQNVLAFCWIIDFPLVEWNEDEQRWDPSHHLFTSPMPEDIELLETDPGKVRGQQYDVVLNGYETAGGSIRIHARQLQEKIFDLIGLEPEIAQERFGHMLRAFEYGTPPHGGIASGLDRLCMVLCDEPNIREVIAFPKNQAARDVMADAPSPAEAEQLMELHLKVVEQKA